jgi:hypothetical protein
LWSPQMRISAQRCVDRLRRCLHFPVHGKVRARQASAERAWQSLVKCAVGAEEKG